MLLVRASYALDEEWPRLRLAAPQLLAALKKADPKVKVRPSAGMSRIRHELDLLGPQQAAAILHQTFLTFGQLGDQEPLRPFRLEAVPSALPAPFSGLPQSQDVAASLFTAEDDLRPQKDRWFITFRSADGDSVLFVRERTVYQQRRDPQTGAVTLDERVETAEFDLRLDRARRVIFVSGGGRNEAAKLARALVTNAIGAGYALAFSPLPTLNAAVLEAAIDSFDARAEKTDVSPTDTELFPWKDLGTREIDLRTHPTIAAMVDQGEQTALTGVFTRGELGASNACPEPAEIAVDISWAITPKTYVEPQMMLALYDRLVDLSALARLLVPQPKAVATVLRRSLGHRLNAARIDRSLQVVRTAIGKLGLPAVAAGDAAQRLFDTVLLNVIIAIGDCAKVKNTAKSVKLRRKELDKIFDEILPSTSKQERSRVQAAMDGLLDGPGGYLGLAQRVERALVSAGC